jgi:hypothetical protein
MSAFTLVRQIVPVERCIILADFHVPECTCVIFLNQNPFIVKYVYVRNKGICNPYKLTTLV